MINDILYPYIGLYKLWLLGKKRRKQRKSRGKRKSSMGKRK